MKIDKKKTMYVSAGRIKGQKILRPPGEIRPITSKVKQALFNIIGDCSGMKTLDLFGGSGSITLEAYSRGAEECVIVEADVSKKNVILENLKNADFQKCKVVISDALRYCKNCSEQYDFIMLDPPFVWDKKEELLELIGDRNMLSDDGILVLHVFKKEEISPKIGKFVRYDQRTYGSNTLMFYKNESNLK
ncbi:MAG TPA: 16S rRNA (guanine(966)-N(2))-methyltransferase RsmD [Spirochaetota bacterium]|nr:16S rRNA (guanine(966)-N(2))-methyltransferase RsmD [Spirochaetota bacterium]HQB61509.1 16S rRNA (guanine(966)-N(2))-methyltransferase RsmD [Spirochaetota bacterium]